jgi:hypothetical protein
MHADASFEDIPSLTGSDSIIWVRPGEKLRYVELTAREKRDYLFDLGIRATAYAGELPDVVKGLFEFAGSAVDAIERDSLSLTLTRSGDELERPQHKLFHTYGTTAKIVFTPLPGTPYSGLFAQSAPGLARFSYAGPTLAIGVVPGLGLKFPLDYDHASQNVVLMRKLDRQQPLTDALSQDRYNSVFQNCFTNILPSPSATNVTMHVVKRAFEKVVTARRGLHQPVDNLAAVTLSGERLDAARVRAPFRIILRPRREATSASDPTIDFRIDLARNIRAGTPIYDVLALTRDEEEALNDAGVSEVEGLLPHARRLGTLTTESEFLASRYGDYRLFFQHNAQFIRDEYRP